MLGRPPDGPQLELPWRSFAYAGKFVMTNTGKAVAMDDETIVAAAAFNEDRTESNTAWIRYVTVHEDRRGDGIGPRLVRSLTEELLDGAYERVKIGVNNPYAYEALYKAGFGFTGDRTGMAELVLVAPPAEHETEQDAVRAGRYRQGMRLYLDRDLPAPVAHFAREKLDRGTPPDRVKGIC